jgi:hypothetical protein
VSVRTCTCTHTLTQIQLIQTKFKFILSSALYYSHTLVTDTYLYFVFYERRCQYTILLCTIRRETLPLIKLKYRGNVICLGPQYSSSHMQWAPQRHCFLTILYSFCDKTILWPLKRSSFHNVPPTNPTEVGQDLLPFPNLWV